MGETKMKKKRKNSNNLMGTTKQVVGSGMLLGVGGMALGGMAGMPGVPANLTSKTIGTGATMMGAAVPAMYGMQTLNYLNSIFAAMKSSRQRMDLSKQAKTTFEVGDLNKKNFNMWKKKPSRFDIMGVDSKY